MGGLDSTVINAQNGFDHEIALLRDWGRGDRRAGSLLYSRYSQCVQRFFFNKTRGADEHGDLVHDTFLALRRADAPSTTTGTEDAPLRPFILGVAHNIFRNHIRGMARRRRRELDLSRHTLGELQPGASSVVRARRQAQALMDGLRNIPIDGQVLLELKYFEGLSFNQMADVLGVGVTCLNGRLARARQQLFEQVRAAALHPTETCEADALEAWAAEVHARIDRRSAR